jgi:hypothetical protein
MNQDHLLKCTVLNTENTPIEKLYWDTYLQIISYETFFMLNTNMTTVGNVGLYLTNLT